MGIEDCPLPEVAEALRPYIKRRDEVAAIRRGLQNHLQSQLRTDRIPLSSVNLTIPPDSEIGSPPPALTGVRKAYWKALQTHAAAQARYDALRAELDRLKHHRPGAGFESNQPSTSVNEHYIPLLRQKEKQRKLKAIQTAYSEIASAGGDLFANSLDDTAKKQIGELPTPPSSHPYINRDPNAEAIILELKKALISTNRRVDERKQKMSPFAMACASVVSPQAEIIGLQRALQELTGWMESQLGVIANAEVDTQSSPARDDLPANKELSTEIIEALYNQYLETRERLIQSVNKPPEAQLDQNIEDLVEQAPPSREINSSTRSAAEIVLPYIPTLVSAKRGEQAVRQQNAYVRRHISSAEAETERLLHRLADESHLVQPGATSGKDWAGAAREAGAATESFVRERLEAGEASASSTDQALESIRSLSASVDSLRENLRAHHSEL